MEFPLPRPKGPPRTHINIAPRSEVVATMKMYADDMGQPVGHLWELAARRFLAAENVTLIPVEAAVEIVQVVKPQKRKK